MTPEDGLVPSSNVALIEKWMSVSTSEIVPLPKHKDYDNGKRIVNLSRRPLDILLHSRYHECCS